LEQDQAEMRERQTSSQGLEDHKLAAWTQFRKLRPYRVMLYCAKKNARKKGVAFDLTDKDIVIPEFCPVLGVRLKQGVGTACPESPSLDRIVPSKGYVSGNVRVISYRANTLKSNATADEMRKVLADLEAIENKANIVAK